MMLDMVSQISAADVGEGAEVEPIFYDFADVQAALVDVVHLWRRSPHVGHSPVKSSWPNEMVQRGFGDYDARGGDLIAPSPRPVPLSREEVARRDAVSAWVEHVPGDINRRIVWLAVGQLASGRAQVSWRKVQARLRWQRGRGGVERRYSRAIGAICAALNHPDVLAMVRDGEGPKAISAACGLSFADAYALVRRLKGDCSGNCG